MAESLKSILIAFVVFLIYYLFVTVLDEVVSNVGHSLFHYEEYIVHDYWFLKLPVIDSRSGFIFWVSLFSIFASPLQTPFKRWILSTIFILVPVSPWFISILLATVPTVAHIDVLHTAMVSLRLLLYAFVANKLVGLTIGKSHKTIGNMTGTAINLLLVLLQYLFRLLC